MSLDEFAASRAVADEHLRIELEAAKRDLASSRAVNRQLTTSVEQLTAAAAVRSGDVAAPTWLTPRKRAKGSRGTLMALLSDMHFGEVVRPSEVDWLNSYNIEIGDARLERFFTGIEYLATKHLTGVGYDGIVLMLGGDGLSGSIHEELTQTNEMTVMQCIHHYVPLLAGGISFLADSFGKVHCMQVVGNHPRQTRKPRSKLRAFDNADWLIGVLLAERFADDERVTFDVPDGTDALVRVYDTDFLLTHGDQTSGGGGIGGIWPPIKRMAARKHERYNASGQTFDWLVMGHWHQLICAQGLIVNGALKGYDEYAATNNFAPEKAQQALWVCTPENGVTWTSPVFVEDPKSEGWQRP